MDSNLVLFVLFAFNFHEISTSRAQEDSTLEESRSVSERRFFQMLLILKCRNLTVAITLFIRGYLLVLQMNRIMPNVPDICTSY